jgi:hypothetical protein
VLDQQGAEGIHALPLDLYVMVGVDTDFGG